MNLGQNSRTSKALKAEKNLPEGLRLGLEAGYF